MRGPDECLEVANWVIETARKGGDGKHAFFKNTQRFYWYLLIAAKPFRSVYPEDSPQPLLSLENKSRSAREQCLIDKQTIKEKGLDEDNFLDGIDVDGPYADEEEIGVVQLFGAENASPCDTSLYKEVSVTKAYLESFCCKHGLINFDCPIPNKLLETDLVVYAKIYKNDKQPSNRAATFLVCNYKTGFAWRDNAPFTVRGKAFVARRNGNITTLELMKIVDFTFDSMDIYSEGDAWPITEANLQRKAKVYKKQQAKQSS